MVICDADNLSETRIAPTQKAIETQRQKQLEALMHIRRLLAQANQPRKHKVA